MTLRTLAALALTSALALAGCGGDPEPRVADPAPSVSTSAPTPSPTVSESADSEQAYRDFIESYVDAISRSLSTGDPSEWLAMSSPECSNCSKLAAAIRNAYADGGVITGAAWSVQSLQARSEVDGGQVWDAEVKRSAEEWLDGSGTVVRSVKAGGFNIGLAIAGTAPGFTVRELQTSPL